MTKEKWLPEGDGWTEDNVARLLTIWEREQTLAEQKHEALRQDLEDAPDDDGFYRERQVYQEETDRLKAENERDKWAVQMAKLNQG